MTICKQCGTEAEKWYCSEDCHDKLKVTNIKSYHKTKEMNKLKLKKRRFEEYHKNRESYLKYAKEFKKNNPEIVSKRCAKYRLNNKEKDKVRRLHQKFKKDYCEDCGSINNLEIHHIKYDISLDSILTLCHKCHLLAHKKKKMIILGLEEEDGNTK